MRIHALRPGSSLQALSRHATQALFLCASPSPALAGLPHLEPIPVGSVFCWQRIRSADKA
ncbi:hypothetical protein JAB1_32480 [Janthinobacterium sp. MP5059B]|nr:hypothetical protein JAB1_32480 [Janthinobacterium sp. MP5059B]